MKLKKDDLNNIGHKVNWELSNRARIQVFDQVCDQVCDQVEIQCTSLVIY